MGVFSGFRPKARIDAGMLGLAALLGSGSCDLIVEAASRLICGLDPNGCVQMLVGYKNIKHIYFPVTKELRARQAKAGAGEEPLPDSIEGYANFLVKGTIPNELARRRVYWFLYGLALIKVEEIANHDQKYAGSISAIWRHLGECQDIIETVLQDNVLWSDDEKNVGMGNRHQRTPTVYL